MRCFIKKYMFSYFLIYLVYTIEVTVTSKEVFEVSQPSECKNNEYFDIVSFSCMQCDARRNLIPSENRLQCTCNKFSKRIGFKDGYPLCVFCGINATVTMDGNDCVPCNGETCKCASNELQMDRNISGTLLDFNYCFSCPKNTYPFFEGSKCLPCKNFIYNYYGSDTYFTKYHYTLIQKYCFPNSTFFSKQNPETIFQIKYDSKNIDSYYLRNNLQIAIYFCKKHDKQACEHLSNMCVLSLYANDVACKLFIQTQNSPVWLFYNTNETAAVLTSKQITQKYSFMKGNNGSMLNFTIATFSINGDFKSIGASNIPCNLLEHVRFGTNFEKKCKLTVKDLMQTKTEYMSPYLTFIKDENILMYAVPILVKNINRNNDKITDSKLVRKFFFVDNIGGFQILSNQTANKTENVGEFSVLRYMKSLDVIVTIQSIKDKNKIFPPLLIIEYAELTHDQINKTVEITLNYRIKFTMENNNINSHLMIIIGICLGLSLLLSAIKTWSYRKRHHDSSFNVWICVWFFIYTMGTAGSIIILCLVSLCLYLFMFYKGQTIPYILLPEDVSEDIIKSLTIVAFCFKLVEMIGFICQYWNTDIFFIDWEQAKTLSNQFKYDLPYEPVNALYIDKLSNNKYKHIQMSSETITAKRKKISYKLNRHNNSKPFSIDTHKANVSTIDSISKTSNETINENTDFNDLPISIWRTYFIASQWLKLQTKRKINVMVQWTAVLCTFQIIQLYPWILAVPDLTSKFPVDNYNFILYYTVCILTFILIYCTQLLVSVVFWEQCVTNKMQEFINLCSVANISILILPFNYYGFYIHGRSVHGFADTDLPALINNLQMEKSNLCAHRGLVPGTTQQTFILYLTKMFRTTINKDFKLTKTEQSNLIKTNSSTTNWENVFNTQLKIKQFLCKFIDHCIKKEDYTIKEQHFFEKLFNVAFSHNKRKSIFYIDNNYSFNQVLLYGNEWLLATFDISIYTFIIVLCEDCTIAIIITVLISMLSTMIVKHNGKKHLNNYTLLDKIFLR